MRHTAYGMSAEASGTIWGPREFRGKAEITKWPLRKTDPMEVTQMVTDRKQDSDKTPVKQGPEKIPSAPNRIGPATPYDFDGKNLTAYGGLLPVGTLLEKLGFQQLVEETLKVKRADQGHASVSIHSGNGAGLLRGLLAPAPPAVSPARAYANGNLGGAAATTAMHLLAVPGVTACSVAGQLLEVQRRLRQRVWEAANV